MLSRNLRQQINIRYIFMTEQKFDVNLKLYWIYIYEPQIQTSTQSAPVSVGKALVLNCYFYMIRQEMEIFLDQL